MTWLEIGKAAVGPAALAWWLFSRYAPFSGKKSSDKIEPTSHGKPKISNTPTDKKKFRNDVSRPFLKTDRAKFLDSRSFLDELVRAVSTSDKKQATKGENEIVRAQIREILFAELADERGAHIETLLTAVGAIAGFSVQMMLREAFVDTGQLPEERIFSIFGGADGEKYFSGDNLNEGLLEPRPGNLSVWSLVGGAPYSLGKPLPDVGGMVETMARSYGSPNFGVPDLPQANMPNVMPKELLSRYWNIVRNIQMMNAGTIKTMPFSLAQIAQHIIIENQTVIDPTLGARIAMEAALRMSRIDPKHVPFARFQQPA